MNKGSTTFIDNIPMNTLALIVCHFVSNMMLHDGNQSRIVESAAFDYVAISRGVIGGLV